MYFQNLDLRFSLAANVKRVMNGPILSTLLCDVVYIPTSLFQLSLVSSLNLDLLAIILSVLCATVTMLLMCYLSHKITTELFEISDIIYQSSWYEYSEPSKRLLLLMMMKAQRPVEFSGFGLINSSLETYLKASEHRWK